MRDPSKSWIYPARYVDARGSETTNIANNGETLTMAVRGVVFEGWMFDDFTPVCSIPPDVSEQFQFNDSSLCACTIECDIPIPTLTSDGIVDCVLRVSLDLGPPGERGAIQWETLKLSLQIGNEVFSSVGTTGWFEDDMIDLQRKLPPELLMSACINCQFSDYSPFGHGLIGGLVCFRNCKAEYRQVKSKAALFQIWDQAAGKVQETYLCPEFERRVPGTGYRG